MSSVSLCQGRVMSLCRPQFLIYIPSVSANECWKLGQLNIEAKLEEKLKKKKDYGELQTILRMVS